MLVRNPERRLLVQHTHAIHNPNDAIFYMPFIQIVFSGEQSRDLSVQHASQRRAVEIGFKLEHFSKCIQQRCRVITISRREQGAINIEEDQCGSDG